MALSVPKSFLLQEESESLQEELENNMLTALYLIVIVTKIAKQTDTAPTEAMQVSTATMGVTYAKVCHAEQHNCKSESFWLVYPNPKWRYRYRYVSVFFYI